MSYDLLVFDPAAAPADREGFMAWFNEQTKWGEGHSYNDPAVCSENLRAWFFDMIKAFPALNGPHRAKDDDLDDPRITDYSIGRSIIDAGFRWSEAEPAYQAAFDLAKRHRLGFFDMSADDGEVWLPTADGGYQCVHGTSRPGTPRYFVATAKLRNDND